MNHFIKLAVLFSIIFLICVPKSTYAIGFGLYFSPFNAGNSIVDWDNVGTDTNNWNTKHWGYGFIFDTRVARKGTFNYRLNVGFEIVEFKEKRNETNPKDSYFRFKIDNTFGFDIIQSSLLRLWFGPQIRLANERFPVVKYVEWSEYDYDEYIDDDDGSAFGVGIAPVLGINLNLGNKNSLSFDFGYRLNRYIGRHYTGSGVSLRHEQATITEKEIFFNFSYIFRIRDVFK